MFEKYDPRGSHEVEKQLVSYWEELRLLEQLHEKNRTGPRFVFYDGPVTANNPMGVHHAWGRTYKDVAQRYWAMRGYNLRFQNGFDTQGLWLEVEVEKSLGLQTKKDILEYGLEEFADACKARISKYSQVQTDQSRALGQLMDWENSYFTHADNNIEMIWHFLKVCHERGWLYRADRAMPWCWRCGTSLSKHEQADSYRELTHTAVFAKFPLVDGGFLLVWTTTPWTLPANTAVAVHPDIEYGLFVKDEAVLYAGRWMEDYLDGYALKQVVKGSDLVGMQYQTPFGKATRSVYLWTDVTGDEGTGIVHIAPGCGEEDFHFGKLHELEVIHALDENGYYLEGNGDFSGKFYTDANVQVVEHLQRMGLLAWSEECHHRYPVCWRCKEELVFRLVEEWFIRCDEVRSLLRETSKEVVWNPPHVGKLFENWLENMGDWCISRKRFWGQPLPFYPCQCGHLNVIGSASELRQMAVEWTELPELHRPWIDQIKVRCSECGGHVARVLDVGDCWLDAGVMPFSTLNYLSDHAYWESWFPADFVCEMREQVRLWFYSMMFVSTTLEGRAPFRYVHSYERVNDKDGNVFHKTGPNAIVLDDVLESMGADALRFMYLRQNNALSMRFDPDEPAGQKLLGMVYNSAKFFLTYARLDGVSGADNLSLLDLWMVQRLSEFVQASSECYAAYEFEKLAALVEEFMDDYSNWYVRLSRRRVWEGDPAALVVMRDVLLTLSKVLAPALPFISELLYLQMNEFSTHLLASVHLEQFPTPATTERHLLPVMRLLRKFVLMGRELRNSSRIRFRQPLRKALVWSAEFNTSLEPLLPLLAQELNVKKVRVLDNPDWYLSYSLIPNYSVAGPTFGSQVTVFADLLANLRKKEVKAWMEGEEVRVSVSGKDVGLSPDLVSLKVSTRKGYTSSTSGELALILDTRLDDSLLEEGLLRDAVRHVQQARKALDLPVDQVVDLRMAASPRLQAMLSRSLDVLGSETLSRPVWSHLDDPSHEVKVGSESLRFSIVI